MKSNKEQTENERWILATVIFVLIALSSHVLTMIQFQNNIFGKYWYAIVGALWLGMAIYLFKINFIEIKSK